MCSSDLPPLPAPAEAAADTALPRQEIFTRPPGGLVGGVVGGVPPVVLAPSPEEKRLDLARARRQAGMSIVPSEAATAAKEEAAAVGNAAEAHLLRYITEGPLHTGQPIRLEFESFEPGWVYVFTADSEGWRLAASARIDPDAPASVSLRFDEPGRKELLAVLSRSEHSALREGAVAVPPAAAASRRIALDVTRP